MAHRIDDRASAPRPPSDSLFARMTAIDLVIVRSPVAPLVSEARVSAMQVSQVLAGHPLLILERRDDWLRARGLDEYEGWIHRGYVRESDDAPGGRTAPAATGGLPAAFRWARGHRISLGCVVRGHDGQRRTLPLAAIIAPDDGVESGTTLTHETLLRTFPRDARAIARTALERFEGTGYEWGGITPWGGDCSGLVQMAFGLHGVALPRDAWQQAGHGEDTGRDLESLRAADLLFFSDRDDGRITHVGIALGEMRMVHLALGRGGYAVEALEADDPYVVKLRERFRFGRRLPLGA
jgi:hypothetical protein